MSPLLLIILLTTTISAIFPPSIAAPYLHHHHNLTLSIPITSAAPFGIGQYIATVLLGSPPQPLHLILDTSSDLPWVPCSSLNHHFHPRLSSSFHRLPCSNPLCSLLSTSPSPTCPCRYSYSYSDLSSTSGLLSLDSLTLTHVTRNATRPFTFGCSLNSTGPSLPPSLGVLALGNGPTSLPSQLRSPSFSYCLQYHTLDPPPVTQLVLNPPLPFTHPHQSFTPLLRNPLSPTFHYVSIRSVLIDASPLPIDPSLFALDPRTGLGGTVMDTGTTLTLLPEEAYRHVLAGMERRLRLPRVVLDESMGRGRFDLCVNVSGVAGRELPRLGFKMESGAVMLPPPRNYFVEVEDGVRCLAVQPAGPDGFGIIGNLMQQGFLFVFDRVRRRLGWSRTGCSA